MTAALHPGNPGSEQRDRGIERAARGAGKEWVDVAVAYVGFVALHHKAFTCELARNWAEKNGLDPASNNHAWGHVMRLAQQYGYISPTNVHVPARDSSSHCGPVRVWKSNIILRAA
jgi:hypothetical protein